MEVIQATGFRPRPEVIKEMKKTAPKASDAAPGIGQISEGITDDLKTAVEKARTDPTVKDFSSLGNNAPSTSPEVPGGERAGRIH